MCVCEGVCVCEAEDVCVCVQNKRAYVTDGGIEAGVARRCGKKRRERNSNE